VIREALAISGLEAVTRLVGLRHDVPRLMAALDVLASSSSYGEAFPNVLGEAMASGVPCAVTDVGDSAHIVGDTGIVVGAADMQGLSLAIESLLARSTDPEGAARCGASTRARIAELFEINMIVRRYEDFYHQLLDAR
jgi:glycosyltransferase involved in cell wall biosynthesis